jgi:hypothetical protein
MAGDDKTAATGMALYEHAPLPTATFTAFPEPAPSTAPNRAPPKVCDPEKYQSEPNIINLGDWLFAVRRYMAFTRMEPSRKVLYASTVTL